MKENKKGNKRKREQKGQKRETKKTREGMYLYYVSRKKRERKRDT